MAMQLTPDALDQFLRGRCGGDPDGPALLAKDATSEIGWRAWTAEDSRALCDWLTDYPSVDLTCFNLKEAAALVGVSIPKFQQWIRRAKDPIPHIRDGRTIVIPAFQLREWLREECSRSRVC